MAAYALGKQATAEGRARALKLFPRLADRLGVPARLLSGGEQQMADGLASLDEVDKQVAG